MSARAMDSASSLESTLRMTRSMGMPGPSVADPVEARQRLSRECPGRRHRVQVDGYAGYSGQWFLDAFIVDP